MIVEAEVRPLARECDAERANDGLRAEWASDTEKHNESFVS